MYIYNIILYSIMLIPIVASPIVKKTLQVRLEKINFFYAYFVQKNYYLDDSMLEIGQGELWVQRPNLFHWHMMVPEENFLISDGKTLWFYIPIIKQVTTYWLQDFSDNIFFMFFSDNNILLRWSNYDVHQEGDYFFLTPVNNTSNLKKYIIKITNSGIIEQFGFIEKSNKRVLYYLSKQNFNMIDSDKFHFSLSDDIQLDEQRN